VFTLKQQQPMGVKLLRSLIRAIFGKRYRQPDRRPAAPPRQSVSPTKYTRPISNQTLPKPVTPSTASAPNSLPQTITGKCYVIDGDTLQIGKMRLRLAGIDAPEMEHPWGKKAKWELVRLCKGQVITAELEPSTSYDRVVATCLLPDGRDLSAEMVKAGLALDWPKFSGGKYRHLEPKGVRKVHWKAAARQRGNMKIFMS